MSFSVPVAMKNMSDKPDDSLKWDSAFTIFNNLNTKKIEIERHLRAYAKRIFKFSFSSKWKEVTKSEENTMKIISSKSLKQN